MFFGRVELPLVRAWLPLARSWPLNKYMQRVGTSERDNKNEANMANITASANGLNRNFGIPDKPKIGTNTIQIQSVETSAGNAIWAAPSRIASRVGFFSPMWRWTFSIVTVASSTSRPTASANPPRLMMLMVWPRALRMAMEVKMDNGIEIAMITVLRQSPKKIRIMSAVSRAAIAASRTTPIIESVTKTDWAVKS